MAFAKGRTGLRGTGAPLEADLDAELGALPPTHRADRLRSPAPFPPPTSEAKAGDHAGGTCALLGSTPLGASVLKFRSFEQVSGLETEGLVTSGPYRFSRNPQVVGWGPALLGTSLASRSCAALLLTAAFFFAHGLHAPIEERHLERTFGEQYRRYRANVPRFLGLPRDS